MLPSRHVELLQELYQDLNANGLQAAPEVYIQSVDENLRELQIIIHSLRRTGGERAKCAEASYWLSCIRNLAVDHVVMPMEKNWLKDKSDRGQPGREHKFGEDALF